jgi:hypothetical protein
VQRRPAAALDLEDVAGREPLDAPEAGTLLKSVRPSLVHP